MREIKKLIQDNFKGYKLLHFNQFYKPSLNWVDKLGKQHIYKINPSDAYKKIKEQNATRIGAILIHDSGATQYAEINICTKPTL